MLSKLSVCKPVIVLCLLSLLIVTAISQTAKTQASNLSYVLPNDFWQDVDKLTNFGKNKDLKRVESYSASLMKKWGGRGTAFDFTLTEKICGVLSSYKFEDDHHRLALLTFYAEHALLDADKMTITEEATLVPYLAKDTSEAKTQTPHDWSVWRTKRAKIWLHTIQRIEAGIDKDYIPGAPSTLPNFSIMPPGGGIAGIDPNDVKDPRIRAEYETLIEKNKQKNIKLTQQIELRRLEKHFVPLAERYLIYIYSSPPYDRVEIEKCLDAYSVDKERKTRILDAVARNIKAAEAKAAPQAETQKPQDGTKQNKPTEIPEK